MHPLPDFQQSAIKRSIMLGLGSGFQQSFSFISNAERLTRPTDPNVKIKRPKVVQRRRGVKSAASSPFEWGEQCVDMFEVLNQIGEGTYGQVYKAKDKTSGTNYININLIHFIQFIFNVKYILYILLYN